MVRGSGRKRWGAKVCELFTVRWNKSFPPNNHFNRNSSRWEGLAKPQGYILGVLLQLTVKEIGLSSRTYTGSRNTNDRVEESISVAFRIILIGQVRTSKVQRFVSLLDWPINVSSWPWHWFAPLSRKNKKESFSEAHYSILLFEAKTHTHTHTPIAQRFFFLVLADTTKKMSRPLQTQTFTRPRVESSSDFAIELMPTDKIVKRTLHPWSVHHSVSTSNWIATICRPMDNSQGSKTRHAQFVFPTERDARKFCHAYAPPRLADEPSCQGKEVDGWMDGWVGIWYFCTGCDVDDSQMFSQTCYDLLCDRLWPSR